MDKILKILFYSLLFLYSMFVVYAVIKYFNGFGFSSFFPPFDLINKENNITNIRANIGAFGDFFGGILNPLIGLVGIILIYKTFQFTKEELKTTLETVKKQNKLIEDKNLEDQIYKLFDLLLKLEEENIKKEKIINETNFNQTKLIEELKSGNLINASRIEAVRLKLLESINYLDNNNMTRILIIQFLQDSKN